jgi:uncharacterized protein
MKNAPKIAWNPRRLDMRAFARAGASLRAEEPLSTFARLHAERAPGASAASEPVRWLARGELRPGAGGDESAVWLHLQADVRMSLTCQRCLGPVELPLVVDRWFRFVTDEAAAEAQDDDCEEDLLALEPRPNLLDVLEDELLMALPLVPMHEVCPMPVRMQVGDIGEEADDAISTPKNPFAELARMKK